MISNELYLFKGVYGTSQGWGVWIACWSEIGIGTLHFKLRPSILSFWFHVQGCRMPPHCIEIFRLHE